MLKTFIAVDTETTGLDPEHDRVIELAAVRFEDGAPVATFTALLSPGDRALSPVSRLITGISDAELAAAPPAVESLRAFLEFAGDAPLVAHNAEFDAHFVRKTLAAADLPPPPGPWLDTLLLARTAWPDWDSHRLDALAERLAVPRDDEHRALPDARRAGLVCLAAQAHLRRTLSQEARSALARLAADDAGWRLVFSTVDMAVDEGGNGNTGAAGFDSTVSAMEDAGVAAVDAGASGPLAAAETAETSGPLAAALDEAFDDALAEGLESEVWTALETPPAVDDAAAALAAALRAARSGRRVLLAAPDTTTWNALRRAAAKAVGGAQKDSHAAPQKMPRVVALAEPSGYLCRARLARIVEDPSRVPGAERTALFPLVAWADRALTKTSDAPAEALAAGRGFSPERSRMAWSRVSCETWGDDPGARAAYDAAAGAGVVLVTHATLCAHVARVARAEAAEALLPAADTLVVAGAHRLPDVARSPAGFGRAVTYFRLRELLLAASAPPDGDPAGHAGEDGAWRALTAALDDDAAAAGRVAWFEPERLLQKFLQKAGRKAAKARPQGDFRVRYAEPVATAFEADPAPVLAALRANEELLDRCALATEGPESLRGVLRERLRAFRADFSDLCEAADPETVYWFEDVANPHKAALRAAPRELDGFAAALRDLFGGGVLASPALVAGRDASAARDARWFLGAAGFDGFDADRAPARARRVSDPAASPPRFLAVPDAPAVVAGEPPETFARFLAAAARPFAARGVLVFCPSQTALRALHAALRRALADAADGDPAPPLWAQYADGNRDALARLYAAGRGGYVLALEGLAGLRDADGHAPALWVVTRAPLPPSRDPLLEARAERLQEDGIPPRDARRALWQPPAVLRLKRDYAALCRAGTPPRVVWLADARAHGDGLGDKIAGALGAKAETARGIEELQRKTGEVVGFREGGW